MNRHERRKAMKENRCKSCNEPSSILMTSTFDSKRRCARCHDLHIKSVSAPEDIATNMRTVKAQQLQEAIHQAILRVFPDKNADTALIVQCLGTTAATFAVQRHGAHGDLPASSFVRGMATYIRQVHEALGLPHDLDAPPPVEPSKIILPS